MKKLSLFIALLLTGFQLLLASGPSNTLPVIHINIDNGAEVTSKENYLKAQYWLEPNGCEGVEAIGTAESPLKLQIKGRGNYTFTGFDKKPYRLKLDKKQPLGGMTSSKHFGLLAHADDFRGFLRNTIGFEVSRNLGLPWTPDQHPVEVVINGTYRGLYFLVELIRIDKKRVNITEWEEEDADGNPLDKWVEGGTLVEIDNYDEEGQIKIVDGDGEILRVTYDKSVDPGYEPDGYSEWLTHQFETINSLVFGDKNSNELWNYIDIDDCARFMLTQEITNNYESFHGSCYLHREKGENEKWHFSPVWDFGSAFFKDSFPNLHFWESGEHHNHWAAQLWQFPALRQKMAQYWAEYRNGSFSDLTSYAADFLTEIKDAAACDKERWPQYGNDNLNDKLSYFKSFIKGSERWLDTVLNYEGPGEDPENFVVPEDEDCVYHVFFKQSGNALNWEKVKIFYWDSNFHNLPQWPGTDCTLVEIKGQNYWHYKLTSNQESNDYCLLFDNGDSGKGVNQTYDLKVRKRGVYTIDMGDHAEPSEFLAIGAGPSGMDEIEYLPTSDLEVKINGCALEFKSKKKTLVSITAIDGTAISVEIGEGTTMISLTKGLYIVNGKKYLL